MAAGGVEDQSQLVSSGKERGGRGRMHYTQYVLTQAKNKWTPCLGSNLVLSSKLRTGLY